MTKDLFNLFLIVSAIHGFVFSFFLFVSKKRGIKSVLFINLLVLSLSLNNFQSWVIAKKFLSQYLFFEFRHIPWHFLIAPFFYSFLIHYLGIEKKHKNLIKIVLPIFLTITLIRLGFVYYYNDVKTEVILFSFEKYTIIEEVISFIFSISIFSYSYYILTQTKKNLNDILNYDDLKWISIFFRLGIIAYIFWIVALVITISLNYTEFIYSYYPLRVLTTLLIYSVGYQSIIKLRLLEEKKFLRAQSKIENIKKATSNSVNKQQKTENIEQQVPLKTIQTILRKLKEFEDNKEYINQNITLSTLAKKFNTNTSYLSKIINNYKDNSFSNYINSLRISYVEKNLQANKTIRKFTIKAIAEEAGFSSTDSFSKVFFKIKGVKPSEYIKNLS